MWLLAQGVVSSAEELHALEEQQFTEWQAKLLEKAAVSAGSTATAASTTGSSGAAVTTDAARQGGVGRLSFYEGRLEFWRQLWRTLEMSDIVLMIVDARCAVVVVVVVKVHVAWLSVNNVFLA